MYDRIVLDGELSLELETDGELGVVTIGHDSLPPYTGETVITPTQETQILYTENKTVYSNITINPIPHNFGLITWDGSVLTVS